MRAQLPEIDGYCYEGNYGVHALRVDIGPLTVWFSYKTPVAFRVDGHDKVVRQNDWRQTTGKHINAIQGVAGLARDQQHRVREAKNKRVTSEEFERLWREQVEPLFGALEAAP